MQWLIGISALTHALLVETPEMYLSPAPEHDRNHELMSVENAESRILRDVWDLFAAEVRRGRN